MRLILEFKSVSCYINPNLLDDIIYVRSIRGFSVKLYRPPAKNYIRKVNKINA